MSKPARRRRGLTQPFGWQGITIFEMKKMIYFKNQKL
jgi:hypothetical protein